MLWHIEHAVWYSTDKPKQQQHPRRAETPRSIIKERRREWKKSNNIRIGLFRDGRYRPVHYGPPPPPPPERLSCPFFFFTFFLETHFFFFFSPLHSFEYRTLQSTCGFLSFSPSQGEEERAESRSRCLLVGDITDNRNKNEMPRRQEMCCSKM